MNRAKGLDRLAVIVIDFPDWSALPDAERAPFFMGVSRARQLLAETGLTISQIAEALGFRDVFFFSRQFTQRTGQTPSAYRATLSRAQT